MQGLAETDVVVRSTKTFDLYCKHREALECADQSAECSSVAGSPTFQPVFLNIILGVLFGLMACTFDPSYLEPARQRWRGYF